MNNNEKLKLSSEIISKAKEFGAHLVGIANIEDLKKAPAYTVAPKMPEYCGIGTDQETDYDAKRGAVTWSQEAKAAIIIAYSHPEDQLELDYWYGMNNPIGNRKLIGIVKNLIQWLNENYNIDPKPLNYHIEKGGIYLKDAAVVAGLGCIGKNNLLLTPEYGSRVRLRAMTINVDLPSSGLSDFDPCNVCDEKCIKACPQKSFNEKLYLPQEYGREELPGRNGNFSRTACNIQMQVDEDVACLEKVELYDEPIKIIKYCRNCELVCNVGK